MKKQLEEQYENVHEMRASLNEVRSEVSDFMPLVGLICQEVQVQVTDMAKAALAHNEEIKKCEMVRGILNQVSSYKGI